MRGETAIQRALARELNELVQPLAEELGRQWPLAEVGLAARFDGAKVVIEGKPPGARVLGLYGVAAVRVDATYRTTKRKGGATNGVVGEFVNEADCDRSHCSVINVETWPYGDGKFDDVTTADVAARSFVAERQREVEAVAKLAAKLVELEPADARTVVEWVAQFGPDWPTAEERGSTLEGLLKCKGWGLGALEGLRGEWDAEELERDRLELLVLWDAAAEVYNFGAVDEGRELDTIDSWVADMLAESKEMDVRADRQVHRGWF